MYLIRATTGMFVWMFSVKYGDELKLDFLIFLKKSKVVLELAKVTTEVLLCGYWGVHMVLIHCMVRHGTVRYGSLLGGFPLGTVPDTFLVPPQPRFQAIRTVTKTWRVNSADHWLAGENRNYCVTELATRDPPLQSYPLDLNQHRQRRSGCSFCLNKRTFLYQPQNSSVVVCWGSSDVPLVDSQGTDPVRAWWRDAEGKSLMYILLNLLYSIFMSSVYILTFVCVFCFN